MDEDCSIAVMVALMDARIAFPEYHLVIQLGPGDVLTFQPEQIYHGMISHPYKVPESPQSMLVSMYNSQAQIDLIRGAVSGGNRCE